LIQEKIEWGHWVPAKTQDAPARILNAVLAVPKPNGDVRLVSNMIPLNAVTVPDVVPPFDNERALRYASQASCAFSVDGLSMFDQLRLRESDVPFFCVAYGHKVYNLTRVPQGGVNSPAAATRFTDWLLDDLIYRPMEQGGGFICQMDDWVGLANTEADLAALVEELASRCKKVNYHLALPKLKPLTTAISINGHWVDLIGRTCVYRPRDLEGFLSQSFPSTGAGLLSFTAFTNLYQAYIPDYVKLRQPLLDLMETAVGAHPVTKRSLAKLKHVPLAAYVTNEHRRAFHTLLEMIRRQPVRHLPDPSLAVLVFSDASVGTASWIVAQHSKWRADGDHPDSPPESESLQVLQAGSTRTPTSQHINETEALALMRGVICAGEFLAPQNKVWAFTDSRAASFLMDVHRDASVVGTGRGQIARLALAVADVPHTIVPIKGEENPLADYLSRIPTGLGMLSTAASAWKWSNGGKEPVSDQTNNALDLQGDLDSVWGSGEELSSSFWERLRRAQPEQVPHPKAEWKDEFWVVDGKCFVPEPVRAEVLVLGHDHHPGGHRGISATTTAVKAKFFWPEMDKDIAKFCKSCLSCLQTKDGIIPRPMGAITHGTRPGQVLHADFVSMTPSKRGAVAVCAIVDDVSRQCQLFPAHTMGAQAAVQALLLWVARYGLFGILQTDNGGHFISQMTKGLTKVLGHEALFTTARGPHKEASVENLAGQFRKAMVALQTFHGVDPTDWDLLLPHVELYLNHAPSPSRDGLTPVELMTGAKPIDPFGVLQINPFDGLILGRRPGDSVTKPLADLRNSIEQLRERAAAAADLARTKERARKSKRTNPLEVGVGDFVMYSLKVGLNHFRWQGPARVVAYKNPLILVLETLEEPPKRLEVHAQRIQPFSNAMAGKDVSDSDRRALAAFFKQARSDVARFDGIRRSDRGVVELRVIWDGIEDDDPTWEPIHALYNDVPNLVVEYLTSLPAAQVSRFPEITKWVA
jgi:hypothetical protein